MKIGFLFPGQGAQSIGMGKDLYENYQEVRDIYENVHKITGVDIKKITFDGTEQELSKTQNTQIAVLTMSLAILKLLEKKGINAKISAGLSLGEYTALIYSKCISFEDGVELVKKRGEYMQNLLPEGDWAMAAILGLEDEKVEEVCKKVVDGFVVPVNYNTQGQVVISGEKTAVEQAEIIAKEIGAKKVRILKTSGPFHTKKLIEASNALRKDLEKININKFKTKVVKNINGDIYKDEENIKAILAEHMISPVKFSKCLETMLKMGIDTFVEIGPGKTLSGFVKRIKTEKEIKIYNICDVKSLENTLKEIN
ncbi:MAG: ACP S-malonyltransferase [Clostridia bacterium]